MEPLGIHLLVDFYECDPDRLDDVHYISASVTQAAKAVGATILNSTFHRFLPCGITGILSLQESHLSIHTWPENRFAAVDIFTCGKNVNPWHACDALKEALRSTRGTAVEMCRGLLSLKERRITWGDAAGSFCVHD